MTLTFASLSLFAPLDVIYPDIGQTGSIDLPRRPALSSFLFAPDDFCSGYGSLGHLKKLSLRELKIARVFIGTSRWM